MQSNNGKHARKKSLIRRKCRLNLRRKLASSTFQAEMRARWMAKRWNLLWPIGTAVKLHPERKTDPELFGFTRTLARPLGDTVVIWLAEEGGCFELKRIEPLYYEPRSRF